MNFSSILIGSTDPQRLADYYTRLFGEPAFSDLMTPMGPGAA